MNEWLAKYCIHFLHWSLFKCLIASPSVTNTISESVFTQFYHSFVIQSIEETNLRFLSSPAMVRTIASPSHPTRHLRQRPVLRFHSPTTHCPSIKNPLELTLLSIFCILLYFVLFYYYLFCFFIHLLHHFIWVVLSISMTKALCNWFLNYYNYY